MDECLQWFDGDGVEQVQPLPLDQYNGVISAQITSDAQQALDSLVAKLKQNSELLQPATSTSVLPPPPCCSVYHIPGGLQLLPAPPIAVLQHITVDAAQFVGTSDAISVGFKADYISLTETAKQIVDTTRTQLRLFDTPLPPAPPEPAGVTDWYHTEQRPYRNGIYEVQQTFGEIHRLYYHTKKDQWYYVADDNTSMGTSCCAGDSLHIIACGWRGCTGPAEA